MLQILAAPPLLFCLLMFSGATDWIYSSNKMKYQFSPDTPFFPAYLAAKSVPRHRLSVRKLPYTEIIHAGKLRYGVGLGGQFKLFRYTE